MLFLSHNHTGNQLKIDYSPTSHYSQCDITMRKLSRLKQKGLAFDVAEEQRQQFIGKHMLSRYAQPAQKCSTGTDVTKKFI